MFESKSPSQIDRLRLVDFSYKHGYLAANAELLNSHLNNLGTFNHIGLWSDKTRKAIEELVKCLEEDMGEVQFGGKSNKKVTMENGDDYEEAVVHEHIEYLPDEDFDLETQL